MVLEKGGHKLLLLEHLTFIHLVFIHLLFIHLVFIILFKVQWSCERANKNISTAPAEYIVSLEQLTVELRTPLSLPSYGLYNYVHLSLSPPTDCTTAYTSLSPLLPTVQLRTPLSPLSYRLYNCVHLSLSPPTDCTTAYTSLSPLLPTVQLRTPLSLPSYRLYNYVQLSISPPTYCTAYLRNPHMQQQT